MFQLVSWRFVWIATFFLNVGACSVVVKEEEGKWMPQQGT